MSIIKIAKRDDPFVVVRKQSLEDPVLSYKATGLHAYLMSKPDGWKIRIDQLVAAKTDGRKAVRSALAELRVAGYARTIKTRDASGKITGTEYQVFDIPFTDDTKTGMSVVKNVDPDELTEITERGMSVVKNADSDDLTESTKMGTSVTDDTEMGMSVKGEKSDNKYVDNYQNKQTLIKTGTSEKRRSEQSDRDTQKPSDGKGVCIVKNDLSKPINRNIYVETEVPTQNKKKKTKYDDDHPAVILSQFLVKKIRDHHPTFSHPNIQTWAIHVDRLLRINKKDKSEIAMIIAFCQKDPFWQTNILSTLKLREKYEELFLKYRNHLKKKEHDHEKRSRGDIQAEQLRSFSDEGNGHRHSEVRTTSHH